MLVTFMWVIALYYADCQVLFVVEECIFFPRELLVNVFYYFCVPSFKINIEISWRNFWHTMVAFHQ